MIRWLSCWGGQERFWIERERRLDVGIFEFEFVLNSYADSKKRNQPSADSGPPSKFD